MPIYNLRDWIYEVIEHLGKGIGYLFYGMGQLIGGIVLLFSFPLILLYLSPIGEYLYGKYKINKIANDKSQLEKWLKYFENRPHIHHQKWAIQTIQSKLTKLSEKESPQKE